MKWIVIGVICLIIVLLWVLGKFVERTFAYRPPSPPTPSPPASTGSATTTATAPPTSPTPPTTPTPAPAPKRSYGWGWPVIGVVAVVFLIWGLPALRTPALPPQAVAPKKELQKFTVCLDSLSFNREKSRGVRVEKNDGFTTIIVKPEPEGELIYDFDLASDPSKSGDASH